MGKILVVGSANADLMLQLPRMPLLGETLTGSGFQCNAGGKGLNQAMAVKKLGGDVTFWGSLGDDANGAMLLREMEEQQLPFVGQVRPGLATGVAVVSVVRGDNFILLDPGANAALTIEEVLVWANRIKEADFVLLQLEIPLGIVHTIAQIAHSSGTKVILNPAPCQALPDDLYPLIDYLVPNEVEVRQLTGITVTDQESGRRAMQELRQRGVGTVIITLGDQGCCYSGSEGEGFLPAVRTEVVDTTSAGDTFIGALCCSLARGESLEQAARYGNRAAAITVSRSGAARSIPCRWEVGEN